jgi:hypothetical protein
MKTLIFSYGSLILPENLEKFKSKILKSVFIKDFDLEINKSPITKTNYHNIQLIKGKSLIPGFLIETENIEAIDRWEGSNYMRKEISCFTRQLEEIKCFAYFKKNFIETSEKII